MEGRYMQQDNPTAGIGARSWAFLIDWSIRSLLALVVFILLAALNDTNSTINLAEQTSDAQEYITSYIFPFVAALSLYLLYHPILEIAMHGQTPGKRYAGIRVVAQDGSPASVLRLLVRNLMRVIDTLPMCYSLGLCYALYQRDQRRIGDKVAGTKLVYTTSLPG